MSDRGNGAPPPVDDADLDLAEVEAETVALAAAAGQRALDVFRHPVQLEFKGAKQDDPVTATDRALESFLRAELGQRYPTHGFVGEEMEDSKADARFLWVIDPLDGTANFASSVPLWGCSVGLLDRGVPVLGAIFVPVGPGVRPGVFHARRGGGAYFDDERLTIAEPPDERGRLMALPGGYLAAFRFRRAPRKDGMLPDGRSLGSCTAELVLVASGGLRGTTFLQPRVWDLAGGIVTVEEAGAAVLEWSDHAWRRLARFDPLPPLKGEGPPSLRNWSRPVIAASPVLAERLVQRLAWHPRLPRPLQRALGLTQVGG